MPTKKIPSSRLKTNSKKQKDYLVNSIWPTAQSLENEFKFL